MPEGKGQSNAEIAARIGSGDASAFVSSSQVVEQLQAVTGMDQKAASGWLRELIDPPATSTVNFSQGADRVATVADHGNIIRSLCGDW